MGAAELWIEEDAGNYDPGTRRFLQLDKMPGNLNDPRTIASHQVYVANNPANLLDPTGNFFWVVLGIVAAISGLIAADLNYNAAKAEGLSGWNLFGSTLLGFVTGASVVGLSIAMPALAPLWGGLGAFVNNAGNQWIDRGSFSKIDWSRALFAGLIGGATGWAFGKLFAALPGVNRVFTEEGQAVLMGPVGTLAGNCVDFGFGSSENFQVYCGINLKPGNQVPQQSH